MKTFKVIKSYAGIEVGSEAKARDNDLSTINYMVKHGYWEEIEAKEPIVPEIKNPETKEIAPKLQNKIPREIKRRKRK